MRNRRDYRIEPEHVVSVGGGRPPSGLCPVGSYEVGSDRTPANETSGRLRSDIQTGGKGRKLVGNEPADPMLRPGRPFAPRRDVVPRGDRGEVKLGRDELLVGA